MTQPVPNINSPLVDKTGKLISPWNSFFQQFTQAPPNAIVVAVGASPLAITPGGAHGTLAIQGGTLTAVKLIRGTIIINVGTTRVVPMRINDTVEITYAVAPTAIYFLPD